MNNPEITLTKKETTLKSYTRQQALNAAIEYFNGDEMAAEVWVNKYSLKDSLGNIYELTPDDMHKRLAREFARIEKKYPNPLSEEEIYSRIKQFKRIVPQGSPMAGIGNNFQVASVSNCFVIGNEKDYDSYGGILKLDQELVQLMKRRAGVGIDLSFIRPSGSAVKNSALTSTGVVPYMERYSNSTREVAQDGRRGALMESISINHPDAEMFIDAKMDETKVTGANVSVRMSDKFMNAVFNNEKFMSQYPVDSNNPTFTKEVDAKRIWDKIIHNAWLRAEPGVLFWDTIINESIPDCYADLGYKTISTNPCIVGETMVAVADGRNAVSIRQLADEGNDVPVYCYDDKGKVCIRYMRSPRITGFNVPIVKLTLDDGSIFKITPTHKFKLKSGEYKEVKDLKPGDSLEILTKFQAPILTQNGKTKKNYLWFNEGTFSSPKSEHRLIYEFYNNCKIEKGYVIHHKDYDTQNNSPLNLIMMSKYDHDKFHAQDMIGDKNPMRRAQTEWSKEKWTTYSQNMSEAMSGEKNGRCSGYNEEDLRNAALDLTSKLQHRFSKDEWQIMAKERGLPIYFSGWRKNQLNGGITGLAKWAAIELGLDKYSDIDPRVFKNYKKLLDNGYDAEIINGDIIVHKMCETCDTPMDVRYTYKEISKCCSVTCYNKKQWSNEESKKLMIERNKKYQSKRKEKIAQQQLEIFTKLKFQIGNIPMRKEWEIACKENGVSYEIGRKSSPIKKWDTLVEMASTYNHRVVSVEIDTNENVYNGTVDEYHNFFIGHIEQIKKNGHHNWLYINNLNCGEIPLCNDDSCRLLAINLYGYVLNPFTKKSKFDFETFAQDVRISQRLMDDLIDIELEKIDLILNKIENDPEPDYIKQTEKNLWLNIKKKCLDGRRTGLGITAEGDMLAALGIRYGSDEGNNFTEKVSQFLKINAYRSSVELAKERGAFPIYDSKREEKNPFINRIKEEDKELYNDMIKYGRRNIAILTIAPTGSVSIMTQTTSGIEPAFLISYMRRIKINPNDENLNNKRVDFIDKVGDSWQNYPVFHHKFKDYLVVKGYDLNEVMQMSKEDIDKLIEESPYHKATANDVDWIKKVEMQGRVQKHVDHSISVTVNLPKDVTEELVANVYETGWRSGCKGMTIYRDGCRSGVLVSNDESKIDPTKIQDTQAPKRPKTLPCDIYHVTANGEQYVVIVGMLDTKPYEVFAFKPKSIHIPIRMKTGNLIKIKKGVYNLDIDGFVIEDLGSHFNADEHEVITRCVSGLLRHGMGLKYIVDILNKSEGTIVSFGKSIARTLKRYMAENEESTETCSNCQQAALVYQEGCLLCTNCGVSKCG